MRVPDSPVLQTVVGWLLVGFIAGCSAGPFSGWPWPFQDAERTAYITPSKRIAALRALADQASRSDEQERARVIGDLAGQLTAEGDAGIREEMVRTVAAYQTPAATQLLIATLKDGDADVQALCCRVLGERRGAEAFQALSEVIQNETEVDVRLAATRALSRFQGPEVVPALAAALEDSDPALQYRAVQSLRTATGQDYGNDVGAWRRFVRGEPPQAKPTTSIAERIRDFSPF